MNFNDYQEWTSTTAIYRQTIYPILGLAEETGGLIGKIGKSIRDLDQVDTEAIKKEAGDFLWMLARIMDDYGIALSDVAQSNIDKLESRKARNVIGGSGDER